MAEDFVHLHLHSEYSILDGAIKFPELMEKLRALGMKAVALTDHGNLFGAIEFYKYARDYGIKPIIGMEAYITAGDMREKDNADKNYHLTLLALNEKGYRNLLFLSSKAYLEGFYYKPRIDKKLLAEHSEGLVALSGCLKGEIPHKYLMEDEEAALEAAY
ncbi:MAG TPA: PHP domain-containing protein, partial [candidate division WOR-3 bacterium]|nr:PHP domain-containing protein [candidate division WOR-3 bacterium]